MTMGTFTTIGLSRSSGQWSPVKCVGWVGIDHASHDQILKVTPLRARLRLDMCPILTLSCIPYVYIDLNVDTGVKGLLVAELVI